MINYLNPLIWLRVTFDIFIVSVCIMLLFIGYIACSSIEKTMTFYEWIKVLAFRSFAYSGMCLINLMCAIGFSAQEMIKWRKKLEKTKRQNK